MARTNGKSEPQLDVAHELPAAGDESAPAEATVDVAALEADLEKTKQEREALLDRLARMQAEFENARKRAAREQQEYRDFALAEAIKLLLPILDSFDRALASDTSGAEFRSGMELIDKQLHDALAKLGVEVVPARGQTFDPNVHQALEMVDTTEAEDNTVVDELQTGYKLKGRLLRPAMVRVARNPGA
ncbi:MAG: nucleotide exchange factor GrpE [Terriglobales bacterium]